MQFTSKDVCDIIKSCADSGVTTFKCGDLCISFIGKEKESPNLEANAPGQVALSQEKIDEQEFVKRTQESKDEMLSRMAIEDPVQFEALLMAGELEDGTSESNSEG